VSQSSTPKTSKIGLINLVEVINQPMEFVENCSNAMMCSYVIQACFAKFDRNPPVSRVKLSQD
jgi:hypothetical protein